MITNRLSITIPAAGATEYIEIRVGAFYVEAGDVTAPGDVPTIHLGAPGGDGWPAYPRTMVRLDEPEQGLYVKGTAVSAGTVLHVFVSDDPCAVLGFNKCAPIVEEAELVTPTAYEKLIVAYKNGTDTIIAHCDFDGSNLTGLRNVGAPDINDILAYDETLDRFYFLVQGTGLATMPADGSAALSTLLAANVSSCRGAHDPVNRKIYFGTVGAASGDVRVYNIATGIFTLLYSSAAAEAVSVAYDKTRNMLYVRFGGSDIIRRMNVDGTGAVDIHAGTSWTDDLVIDPFNGILYYLEDDGFGAREALHSVNLGTLASGDVVTGIITNITQGHLALRLEEKRIYIVDKDGNPGTLTKYLLDGTDPIRILSAPGTGDFYASMPTTRAYI